MSINKDNVYEGEYAESIYCDNCRMRQLIYKCAEFQQYEGWYCRSCFELIDEDADDEDDNNFIITIDLLRCYIKNSTPNLLPQYYKFRKLNEEIKNLNKIYKCAKKNFAEV